MRIFTRRSLAKKPMTRRVMSIALFALVFSLTSALIAIYFQTQAERELSYIDLIRNDQLALREAQEKIVDQIILSRSIKDRYYDGVGIEGVDNKSTCAVAYSPLLRSSYELYSLIELAIQVSSKEQSDRFRLSDKKSKYSNYINLTKKYHLSDICSSKKISVLASENNEWIIDLQSLLNLSAELKRSVSKKMDREVNKLMSVYSKSRSAILVAFILQLIIFALINYLDIKTFRLSGRSA